MRRRWLDRGLFVGCSRDFNAVVFVNINFLGDWDSRLVAHVDRHRGPLVVR